MAAAGKQSPDRPAPAAPQTPPQETHPAVAAGIPVKTQKKARKVMNALVEALKKHDEKHWKELTVKAVKAAPKAMEAYLTAMTVRGAALEAGAPPELVERYIVKLDSIGGMLGLLVKDIPRG